MDILIADADEETRLALVEVIAAIDPNARVTEACDGRELQDAFIGPAPDIVFIDTILPGADAAAIMAWRQMTGAETVVVLVADLLSPHWPNIAQRIDAYDVILKPLSSSSVERVLAATALLRRKLSLLFIEPNLKTRNLAQQVLRQSLFDFSTIEVESGASAVRTARIQSVDLALISFNVKDLPALEVACRINALHPNARIVMVGRSSDMMLPAQLALFGAHAFLPMPFTTSDVDRTVYEVFGLWQPYVLKALREEDAKRKWGAARNASAVVA